MMTQVFSRLSPVDAELPQVLLLLLLLLLLFSYKCFCCYYYFHTGD